MARRTKRQQARSKRSKRSKRFSRRYKKGGYDVHCVGDKVYCENNQVPSEHDGSPCLKRSSLGIISNKTPNVYKCTTSDALNLEEPHWVKET